MYGTNKRGVEEMSRYCSAGAGPDAAGAGAALLLSVPCTFWFRLHVAGLLQEVFVCDFAACSATHPRLSESQCDFVAGGIEGIAANFGCSSGVRWLNNDLLHLAER